MVKQVLQVFGKLLLEKGKRNQRNFKKYSESVPI